MISHFALYIRKIVRIVNSADPFDFCCFVVGAPQVSSNDRSPFAKVWKTDILAVLSELLSKIAISTVVKMLEAGPVLYICTCLWIAYWDFDQQ
jgi:hypothetical protein